MNGEILHHFLWVSSFTEYTVVDVTHAVKITPEIPADKACLLGCGVSTGSPVVAGIGAAWKVAEVEEGSTVAIFGLGPVINELTNGGADYCFECIGLASLMQEAFLSSRKGWGKTVILGVEMHGSQLSLNPYEFLRGRSVTGTLFGGIKPKSDIPLLAKKYLDNELSLDGFISHELSFQDINKAFELHQEGKSLRCIIWMDH
ncbi:alcohol dehydrogenase-like 1 [Quercus suber]|uniref:Alcohol dehydrogenase-like 1 n=1 Tax=Quercus suber TaxID=58331 RepID=A0AAW0JQ06_QUESU